MGEEAASAGEGPSRAILRVFVKTDLVGSAALKTERGDSEAAAIVARHSKIHAQTIGRVAEAIGEGGDGYMSAGTMPGPVVSAALEFQYRMHREPWPEPVRARVGIHLGQAQEVTSAASGRSTHIGLAVDTAGRLEGMALPGQILMTRGAFESARQSVRAHPTVGEAVPLPPIRWVCHGRYRLKGLEDRPVEVFEVGAEGVAPLAAPPDSEKATRVEGPEGTRMQGRGRTIAAVASAPWSKIGVVAAAVLTLAATVFVVLSGGAPPATLKGAGTGAGDARRELERSRLTLEQVRAQVPLAQLTVEELPGALGRFRVSGVVLNMIEAESIRERLAPLGENARVEVRADSLALARILEQALREAGVADARVRDYRGLNAGPARLRIEFTLGVKGPAEVRALAARHVLAHEMFVTLVPGRALGPAR